MNKLTVDSNHLYKDGQVMYEFDHDILDTLEFNDLFFVIIDDKNWKEIYNRNLFCFNKEGQLLWRNEDLLNGKVNANYVSMRIENGEFWAINYFGATDDHLDMYTGKLIKSIYIK